MAKIFLEEGKITKVKEHLLNANQVWKNVDESIGFTYEAKNLHNRIRGINVIIFLDFQDIR